MQCLQRIDQHAGDVAPLAQHAQRVVVHLLQRVGLVRGDRVADARLHVAPPAVIRAAEAHEVRAPRVIARKAHRLHHRFGAGHVERHFVETGDLSQAPDVVRHHRMQQAEHRTEVAHALGAAGETVLVEVVAEDIHAVRAGKIVGPIAVEIGQHHAVRSLHEGTGLEMSTNKAAELERYPVGPGELQVGDAVADLAGQCHGRGVAFADTVRPAA